MNDPRFPASPDRIVFASFQTSMGARLSKIYTRTGDGGDTGLGDGDRVAKNSPRIEAIGVVDELNSVIGLLGAALETSDPLHARLIEIQHDLFDIGGALSMPNRPEADIVGDGHVASLEKTLDERNASLPPLKNFILPGGSEAVARAHHARTVCRRAERRLVTLHRAEALPEAQLRYLNRLSDLLFVLARSLARAEGGGEILWRGADKAAD